MAGEYRVMSDEEWKRWEEFFPPVVKRGRGQPPVDARRILNAVLWMLQTGARWCDLPKHPQLAARSTAHRRFRLWQTSGLLDRIQARFLGLAEEQGKLDLSIGAVDGAFSPGEGRRGRRGAWVQRQRRSSDGFGLQAGSPCGLESLPRQRGGKP